ncbi:ComEA family DNA-binding protein [Pseudomonas sp. NMI795_08]|uniref:ComEA family DNA-binding protein n=1 Tax=Pseudomonas sp. NMI795_08 TaxID=2903144 RepID=UPI001E63CC08|nr:ComEA family DNA-binding protein [Pseudomonas sp. NMI795_08]MCE1118351.1 ComEA family DNA-binding protein [Pseudomonas sp. NMI795_08]
MRNTILSYLLPSLFAGLSLSTPAAAAASSTDPVPVVAAVESMPNAQPMLLNLNTADVDTLQKGLNGIGKAKAEAIVAYREANGAFGTVDELLEIKGIGKALLERNRNKLTVE